MAAESGAAAPYDDLSFGHVSLRLTVDEQALLEAEGGGVGEELVVVVGVSYTATGELVLDVADVDDLISMPEPQVGRHDHRPSAVQRHLRFVFDDERALEVAS